MTSGFGKILTLSEGQHGDNNSLILKIHTWKVCKKCKHYSGAIQTGLKRRLRDKLVFKYL